LRRAWNYAAGILFLGVALLILVGAFRFLLDPNELAFAKGTKADLVFNLVIKALFCWFFVFLGLEALRRARTGHTPQMDPARKHWLKTVGKIVAGLSVGITLLWALSGPRGGMSGVPMTMGLLLAGILYGVGSILSSRR
jgi:hypothetical protein